MAVRIEYDVRSVLLTLSSVTDLVGTGDDARIRPDRPHETDTLPLVIVQVDSATHLNDLTGKGGRVYAEVAIISRAATRKAAWQLAEAIRVNGTDPGTGLAGYTGTINSHTWDAVLDDEHVAWTPHDDGSDQGVYDVYSNYIVTYAETT